MEVREYAARSAYLRPVRRPRVAVTLTFRLHVWCARIERVATEHSGSASVCRTRAVIAVSPADSPSGIEWAAPLAG